MAGLITAFTGLSAISKWVIGVGGTLAVAGSIWFAGFNMGISHESKSEANANSKAAAEVVAQVKQNQLNNVATDNKVLNELEQTRQSLSALQARMARAPDVNRDVHPSVGSLGLLDSAASPTVLPNPPSIPDAAFETPSQVQWSDFIGTELQVRAICTDDQRTKDELIDWINNNQLKKGK